MVTLSVLTRLQPADALALCTPLRTGPAFACQWEGAPGLQCVGAGEIGQSEASGAQPHVEGRILLPPSWVLWPSPLTTELRSLRAAGRDKAAPGL